MQSQHLPPPLPPLSPPPVSGPHGGSQDGDPICLLDECRGPFATGRAHSPIAASGSRLRWWCLTLFPTSSPRPFLFSPQHPSQNRHRDCPQKDVAPGGSFGPRHQCRSPLCLPLAPATSPVLIGLPPLTLQIQPFRQNFIIIHLMTASNTAPLSVPLRPQALGSFQCADDLWSHPAAHLRATPLPPPNPTPTSLLPHEILAVPRVDSRFPEPRDRRPRRLGPRIVSADVCLVATSPPCVPSSVPPPSPRPGRRIRCPR